MKKKKKIRIRGYDFDFRFTKRLSRVPDENNKPQIVDGFCEYPEHTKYPKIRIREGQEAFDEMDTVIHEIIHAGAPKLNEETVTEIAKVATEVLRELGWVRMR